MKKNTVVIALIVYGLISFLFENNLNVYAQEVDENPNGIAHIEVSPDEVNLQKGSGQQFHAFGYDAEGNQIAFNVVWATTGGTITQDGFYAANQGGCHQIFAIDEESGITGEATVVVTCGEEGETCLAVIPGRVSLQVGEQIQFSVFEKSSSGEGEEVSCSWYASGGEITNNGLFTADKLGSYSVTAVNLETGKMGSAHVVVEAQHLLPWWAFTMMGGEWFWVMGVLLGLVVGLVLYLSRRGKPKTAD